MDEYIRGDAAEEKETAGAPERLPGDKESEERCTANTDKVDAEIERLKEKKARLQQQLGMAGDDPEQRDKLQKQLQQIEEELKVKDTDYYRRQHAEYTNG